MKLLTAIKNFTLKLCNSLHRWITPSFSFIALISGTFLTYDFENLKETYPNWHRQIELIRDYLPAVFVISAGVAFVFTLLNLLCEPSFKKLNELVNELKRENEIIAENIKTVFDGYLYQLSKKLEFGSLGENTERVTIYIHNANGSFIPFGRYSANPAFGGPGRSQYPDNQGCISHGWRDGWHFADSFGTTERAYNKSNLEEYDIPEVVTNAIKMKSRLFGVKRIDDGNGRSLAVIVVESMKDDRYTAPALKNILEGEEGVISELISKLRLHIPELSVARARGF